MLAPFLFFRPASGVAFCSGITGVLAVRLPLENNFSVSIETGKFCIYPAFIQLTTITSNAR